MTNDKSCIKSSCCHDIYWWAMLTVAVLAIPALAIIITSALTLDGIGEIAIFVISCWACTYLGMHVMAKSKD